MGVHASKSEQMFLDLERALIDAEARTHAVPRGFSQMWESLLWIPPSSEFVFPPYVSIVKPNFVRSGRRRDSPRSVFSTELNFSFNLTSTSIQDLQKTQVTHGLILTKATQHQRAWNVVITGVLPTPLSSKAQPLEMCIGRKNKKDGLLMSSKVNVEEDGISRFHCRITMDTESNIRIYNHSESNDITVIRMRDGLGHTIPRVNGIVFDYRVDCSWFPIRLDLGVHTFRLEHFWSKWTPPGGDRELIHQSSARPSNALTHQPTARWALGHTMQLAKQHLNDFSSARAEKSTKMEWMKKAKDYVENIRGSLERLRNGCETSVGYGLGPVDPQKWVVPQEASAVAKALCSKPVKDYNAYDVLCFIRGVDRRLRPLFQKAPHIDGRALCALSDEALQMEMGINDCTTRQKILSSIQDRLHMQAQALQQQQEARAGPSRKVVLINADGLPPVRKGATSVPNSPNLVRKHSHSLGHAAARHHPAATHIFLERKQSQPIACPAPRVPKGRALSLSQNKPAANSFTPTAHPKVTTDSNGSDTSTERNTPSSKHDAFVAQMTTDRNTPSSKTTDVPFPSVPSPTHVVSTTVQSPSSSSLAVQYDATLQ